MASVIMAFIKFIKTVDEPKAERIAERKQSGFALAGVLVAPNFGVGSDIL